MKIVTLTLNPCVDETASVREFGESPLSTRLQSGGKGVNVARVLHALGVPCEAVAPCGGAQGELFRRLAREEGVRLSDVPIAEETRRVVTQRRLRDDAQKVEVGRAPSMTKAEIEALRERTTRAMEGAACLCVCGSSCCEDAARLGGDMIRAAKELGIKTLLDGNGLSLSYGAAAKPDLVKPNRRELGQITGHDIPEGEEEEAARELLSQGIGSVIVTLGGKGAAYFSENVTTFCPAPRVKAVNEVGSGDCFTAGFLYAQTKGMNLFYSLAVACACGAANAEMFPAARITKADAERIMGREI